MRYDLNPYYAHLLGRDEPVVNTARLMVREAAFPAPEHTSADPWPEEVKEPRAVQGLRLLAVMYGCETRVQYSRGYAMHISTARPLQLCHHIGVRIRRSDGAAAYAVYRKPVAGDASWKWSNIRTPLARMTLEELKAWITASHPSPEKTP